MRLRFSLLILLSLMVIISCESRERVPASGAPKGMTGGHDKAPAKAHKVLIEEAIHADSYTYLRVTEGDLEYWIATAKQPVEAGMTMFYDQGLEMKDFTSKEIDRTFDSIWFVSKMRGTSSAEAQAATGSAKNIVAEDIKIEKIAGGVSVQELYAGKSDYAGMAVTIKGQVTKFNANIMGRNWVHIQDGTSEGSNIDVTITTDASVNMGDVVVFQGIVTLDKDFGAGYVYDVIIEEAKLIVNS